MRQPEYYSAVFAIIKDEMGRILFQKRQNTSFRDGEFQLPSGHVELGETVAGAAVRELKEEIGIDVTEENIKVVHISHTIQSDRIYFNVYVEVVSYSGIIENLEPEKCSEIGFYDFEDIENNQLFGYETETLRQIFHGSFYSEKIIS